MANQSQPPSPSPASDPQPYKDFSQLEKLYRMYGKYAFGLAKQSLPDDRFAEEIVHEAFLKYWNGTDATIQTLSSISFFGWLLREVQWNCKERILEFKTTTEQNVPNLRSEGI